MKKAQEDGELKREKEKSRKTNMILTATKTIQGSGGFFSPYRSISVGTGGFNDGPSVGGANMGDSSSKIMKKNATQNTLTLNSTSVSNQPNLQVLK
jgi:hypothetical protein